MVHTVLFWLKPELTAAQRAEFVRGVESLRGVKTVKALYVGAPAATPDRPVIDKSYSYCLTTIFDNIAAHDAYQVDPIHLAFVENHKTKWTRVQIYDAE
jgi:Stress responsive A/B Barrel Domain